MPDGKRKQKLKKIGKTLKKVNAFLRKERLLSKGLTVGIKVVPKKHKSKVTKTRDVVKLLGYGKKGAGLGLPGGSRGGCKGSGLKLAGQGAKKRKAKKKPGPKRRVGRPCKK